MTQSVVADQAVLEQRRHRGLGWFYWIAALSVINTIADAAESNRHFILGLGLTQLSDGFFGALKLAPAGWLIDALFVGGFVALGLLARKAIWPFHVGLAVYALDTGIFLIFHDWFAAIVHVIAWAGILGGLSAARKMALLAPPAPVVPEMVTITPQPLPPAPQ